MSRSKGEAPASTLGFSFCLGLGARLAREAEECVAADLVASHFPADVREGRIYLAVPLILAFGFYEYLHNFALVVTDQ